MQQSKRYRITMDAQIAMLHVKQSLEKLAHGTYIIHQYQLLSNILMLMFLHLGSGSKAMQNSCATHYCTTKTGKKNLLRKSTL